MTRIGFFQQYLNKNNVVGSVTPSSHFLRKKMLADIDFSKNQVIVEFGPGTGVFTDEIIRKMTPDSSLYILELNKIFFDALSSRIKDPRVRIFHDSAEKVECYLNHDNLHHADYVLSSLPLAVIPGFAKTKILDASQKILGSRGQYVQFQYSLRARKLLKSYFSDMKIAFTPANVPPAFVYRCSNRKKA